MKTSHSETHIIDNPCLCHVFFHADECEIDDDIVGAYRREAEKPDEQNNVSVVIAVARHCLEDGKSEKCCERNFV